MRRAALWGQTSRSEVTGLARGIAATVEAVYAVCATIAAITGLPKLIAFVAVGIKKIASPILTRFPGPILMGGIVAGILLTWFHSLLFGWVDLAMAKSPAPTEPEHGLAILKGSIERFGSGLEAIEFPMAGVMKYPLYLLRFGFIRDVLITGAIVGVLIGAIPFFAIWWERKIAGRIQSRLGPMRVGGWHGWAQSAADGIKLISKEDLVPEGADKPLYFLAPYLTLVPVVLAFVALPLGATWIFRDLDVGLIFILAMLGVEVVGVIMAGWASNNKWSVYGAMREACQMVSYEIPMGMSLLIPIMCAGTLSMKEIGEMQSGGWSDWFVFHNPFVFAAALCYYIASLASCKRAPFDLPESESELVAGFHTEYSGFRWSLFFFAEYAAMFVVSAIASILFFGAWYSPFPKLGGFDWIAGPIWLVAKSLVLIYVQLWVRWTLPRIRIDQVLYSCVQVMLPLVMLLLLGNAFYELWVPQGGVVWTLVNLMLSAVGAVLVLAFIGIAAYGYIHRRRLVGTLVIDHLPAS